MVKLAYASHPSPLAARLASPAPTKLRSGSLSVRQGLRSKQRSVSGLSWFRRDGGEAEVEFASNGGSFFAQGGAKAVASCAARTKAVPRDNQAAT